MSIFPRTQFGDPILRAKAKPVPLSLIKKPGFPKLIADMFHTMRRADGVGLAAPQIGLSLQLAVIEAGPQRAQRKGQMAKGTERIILINPKLLRASKEKTYDWEGCLSLNGVRGKVPRSRTITVRYTDEQGNVRTRTISGFLARVFQHEIDHLKGTLYVDRMDNMKTLSTLGEFRKRST
jgi:peptide deformylase